MNVFRELGSPPDLIELCEEFFSLERKLIALGARIMETKVDGHLNRRKMFFFLKSHISETVNFFDERDKKKIAQMREVNHDAGELVKALAKTAKEFCDILRQS